MLQEDLASVFRPLFQNKYSSFLHVRDVHTTAAARDRIWHVRLWNASNSGVISEQSLNESERNKSYKFILNMEQ